MIDHISIREPFSDHSIMICDIIMSIQIQEWSETHYDFKRENYEGMNTFLEDYAWKQAFQATDVNTKFDVFKTVVNSAMRHFIHLTKKKKKRKSIWMIKRVELARRRKYQS